ncbi:MAG: threonine-phosphate decarboxylase [Chlorobi bacterium]|nr:threonine-phosphate decarboxylase [Chlorobiota bacterium]
MNSLYHHRHGGQVEPGDDRRQFLDFSVNISPLFPFDAPPAIDQAAMQAYPSIDGRGVREFYTRRFALDDASVLAMNGAIEGIYLLPRALGIRRILLLSPSFYEYGRAARMAGAETGALQLSPEEGFALPPIGKLADELDGFDAFFLANPNNPTGTRFPPEITMALASRFPDKWFFVDEAFVQFLPDFPAVSLMQAVQAFPNIVVVHSLTKFYALPGLRLGALVAHPDTIRKLYDFKEPWTLNAVAEGVARELAVCEGYEMALMDLMTSERYRIVSALSEMPELHVAGGAANFFLIEWRGGCSIDLMFAHLLQQGIRVRDCRNFAGLEEKYFRFAIRTRGENDVLLDAFRTVPEMTTGG